MKCGRSNIGIWFPKLKRPDILLIGDTLVHGKKHFNDVKPFNLGMRGDHVQHVLLRIKFGLMPINPSMVIIHADTNNLMKNEHREIAEVFLQIGNLVNQRLPNSKVVITRLLPRGVKNVDIGNT